MVNNLKNNIPTIIINNKLPMPKAMVNIDIEIDTYMTEASKIALGNDGVVVLVMKKEANYPVLDKRGIYKYGVIANIVQATKLAPSTSRMIVDCFDKVEIKNLYQNDGAFFSDIEVIPETGIAELRDALYIDAMRRELLEKFDEYISSLNYRHNIANLSREGDIDILVSNIASIVIDRNKISQSLLETINREERYTKLLEYLNNGILKSKIRKEIDVKVNEKVGKNQREYILRETLNTIRQELGDGDPLNEYEAYKSKLDSLELESSIKEKIDEDVNKLKHMQPMSQESSVLKSYLDLVFDYPWNKSTNDNLDIKNAKRILEEDHYGLNKVKERILEFIAVKKFNPKGKSPIICLVGPPGTGKTSIAHSIAKSLERKLVRISLGGVRDESEIRGHRRTYIGAMPGRIVKGVIQSGVNNPLILFDEIDKVGSDFRGDPSSALLEVLDYGQNKTFRDNYFELPVDLSKVFFITTANTLATIPRPLLDRMEVIEVNSYTSNEKMHIAKDYLVEKQLVEYGLDRSKVIIKDEAIEVLINNYISEAGVRGLERKIGELIRKSAKKLLEEDKNKITIGKKNLLDLLGNPHKRDDQANKKDAVGIVNGLAWTSVGGCTLQIEVNCMPGKGNLSLTGQMGDVMKESAMIAKSYLRSLRGKYKIEKDFFDKNDIHIHIPEGAVPKDGPSAGITMASAMASAIFELPARADVCMTGEVTLRGRVLPIGGLKEKLLAAKNAGIKTAIVPFANKQDVSELDDEIVEGLDIRYVKDMKEVLKTVLVGEKNDN